MFVLPPPPTYSVSKLYPGLAPGALVETNNVLSHFEEPEHQLVLGEGTYKLRDELHLATPPPHPSDIPPPNNNPLVTTIGPPTTGTRLSLTSLAPKRKSSQGLYRLDSSRSNIPPSISEERTLSTGSELGGNLKSNGSTEYAPTSNPRVFGGDNPALAVMNGDKTKDAAKRKKPKNNIVKSNSSFVSRVIPHEAMAKRLAERNPDGMFAFANISRAVQWLDLSSDTKSENLTKLLFTKANALCHDVNDVTKSATNLDVLLGFNSSDMIWYEPTSQKYTRINKNGAINSSAVSCIYWLPNSENLFLAAHMDGSLVVYDREKEDAPFTPEEAVQENDQAGQPSSSRLDVKKSVQSRNQRVNPVSYWQIGRQKIHSVAFSPDGTHLAVVSEDGTLKIIDFFKERLLDVYTSYYGALLAVTWSPDGRYILTGGQDDLVSIWSFADRVLVARCQGHSSWVRDVKFDPWRCDDRDYRFGSVGEDCKLLLWDFSVGMLGKPKAASGRQRPSVSSPMPRQGSSISALSPQQTLQQGSSGEGLAVVHEVERRTNTAVLPPVMAKTVMDNPLSWLGFEEDCIMVASYDGRVRTWNRPNEGVSDNV